MLVLSSVLSLKQREGTCNFLLWMEFHTQPLVGEWKCNTTVEACIILHCSLSSVALISVFFSLSLSFGNIINDYCRVNILGIKKWPRLKCKNKGGWLQVHCLRDVIPHPLARQSQLAEVLAYVWKLFTVNNIVKCQEHSGLYSHCTILTAEVFQHCRSISHSAFVQNVSLTCLCSCVLL